MDKFTEIDFETGFAFIFRFLPKNLIIMSCNSQNMKSIAFIGGIFINLKRKNRQSLNYTPEI